MTSIDDTNDDNILSIFVVSIFGSFILGALLCAMWHRIDGLDSQPEERIIDQCQKFGSFYSSDDKSRFWCERVENHNQ